MAASQNLWLTDMGIELDMETNFGIELRNFSLYECLLNDDGLEALTKMYEGYIEVARKYSMPIILGSPTWRANLDHMKLLQYNEEDVISVNQKGVQFMQGLQQAHFDVTIKVGGDIGPRGDGYVVEEPMSIEDAQAYHSPEVAAFKQAGAEIIQAITMTYVAEACGIILSAKEAGVPVSCLFTVETDGTLPDGTQLNEAVQRVDAATEGYASYFGVNCSHPTHITPAFQNLEESIKSRVQQIRINASACSHAELDVAETVDRGEPTTLAQEVVQLVTDYNLTVIGGCCGTDKEHLDSMAQALLLDPPQGS